MKKIKDDLGNNTLFSSRPIFLIALPGNRSGHPSNTQTRRGAGNGPMEHQIIQFMRKKISKVPRSACASCWRTSWGPASLAVRCGKQLVVGNDTVRIAEPNMATSGSSTCDMFFWQKCLSSHGCSDQPCFWTHKTNKQKLHPSVLSTHHGTTTGAFACSGRAIEARIVRGGGHYV